uniref:Uncharacterized protein n=1 Tax=Arundo donax TaxID=35708 RepID=A0A0A8ZNM5_ARUDO
MAVPRSEDSTGRILLVRIFHASETKQRKQCCTA